MSNCIISIVGERELRLHSDSHVLRCTVNNLYILMCMLICARSLFLF